VLTFLFLATSTDSPGTPSTTTEDPNTGGGDDGGDSSTTTESPSPSTGDNTSGGGDTDGESSSSSFPTWAIAVVAVGMCSRKKNQNIYLTLFSFRRCCYLYHRDNYYNMLCSTKEETKKSSSVLLEFTTPYHFNIKPSNGAIFSSY